MEVINGLYHKLLLLKKHPGGLYELTYSLENVSLNPRLVAAASHNALLEMDVLPLIPEHVPLTTIEYPNAPRSFFRHDPPPVVE